MDHVKLLDCTLRDGAYLVDKTFGDQTICGIIEGLVSAGIDYIEIGFLQNEGFGDGKTVYRNSRDAKRFLPKSKNGCEFTVLADYSRYSVSNLDVHTEDGIDAVRECFLKQEWENALDACKVIKDKGYKLFIQPVDILGYTDKELICFLETVNEIEPYCLSIVDTFGSMYQEDLHRLFELINHNLVPTCRIGFHSHNNMQLSNALSQEFVRMSVGRRDVVVDGTISGMGRGAGNTPTELMAQYMTARWGYSYDMDALLDVIDGYMDHIRLHCDWGYSTKYFLAGCYSAHVNNIAYLTRKNSIRSKEIRYILNAVGKEERKRYDYSLLEKCYLDLLKSDIDDKAAMQNLKKEFAGKEVFVLISGSSVSRMQTEIMQYISQNRPVVISVNFVYSPIPADYIFVSSLRRQKYTAGCSGQKKIYTSNIPVSMRKEPYELVSFLRLIKCGWDDMDNSVLMLLRLLDGLGVKKAVLAGFDGYSRTDGDHGNYALPALELLSVNENAADRNREIGEMLADFCLSKKVELQFLTPSRFEKYLQK